MRRAHNRKLLQRLIFASCSIITAMAATTSAQSCTDPLGERIIGGGDNETINAIIPAHDGSYLVVGSKTTSEGSSTGFAWGLNPCGDVTRTLQFSPEGGSNFLAGLSLGEQGSLIGGSVLSRQEDDTREAVLLRLDKSGQRVWLKTFSTEQDMSVTTLVARDDHILAVLQPYERNTKDEPTEPLKPLEERPLFLELGLDGQVKQSYVPLTEERTKLFHVSASSKSDTLYASGRFSYGGQPTRPGIWKIERDTGNVQRLFSGNTLGLSFGTYDPTQDDLLAFVWRSSLGLNSPLPPVGFTRLTDGQSSDLWVTSPDDTATLPAAQIPLANGDFGLVLQSFPKKDTPVTITVTRLSATGEAFWKTTLSKPFDSAATSVVETPDGGLILGGRTFAANQKDGDAWLIALDRHGKTTGTTRAERRD